MIARKLSKGTRTRKVRVPTIDQLLTGSTERM